MKRYYGGEKAGSGVYVSLSTGEFFPISKEGGVLPGGQETRYIKPPAPLAAITGLLLGLAYIIFLPLLGIVGVGGFLALKAGRGLGSSARRALEATTFVLKPGLSYLTKRTRQPTAQAEEESLEALKKKIEANKGQQKTKK